MFCIGQVIESCRIRRLCKNRDIVGEVCVKGTSIYACSGVQIYLFCV